MSIDNSEPGTIGYSRSDNVITVKCKVSQLVYKLKLNQYNNIIIEGRICLLQSDHVAKKAQCQRLLQRLFKQPRFGEIRKH